MTVTAGKDFPSINNNVELFRLMGRPAESMTQPPLEHVDKLPDPAAIGNAGSFFKNPVVSASMFDALLSREPDIVGYPEWDGRSKLAAGWLIDRCGWRGKSLPGSNGRAAIHDRQALVLVNRGGATGADVMALASAVRASVLDRFGIELEIEPLVV